MVTGPEYALVVVASFCAGAINAAAGGGSLITYPVLLAAGLGPLAANVTNTVGLAPGHLGGIFGHRSSAPLPETSLRRLLATGVGGALCGAALLLTTPERVFDAVVPALVLLATVLVVVQPWLLKALQRRGFRGSSATAVLAATFAGGVYGAYFGAAVGVILLAVFALTSAASWQLANAVKTRLAFVINIVAALVFLVLAPVNVAVAAVMAAASIAGGYLGGGAARRAPVPLLRALTAVLGAIALVRLLD